MDTTVKRAKSTALGQKCNPSRGLLNTEKPFPPKKGRRVPKKTLYICYCNLHMTFDTEEKILTYKRDIQYQTRLIYIN